MTLKILDLFSGIGGFSLGLEATGHFETKAFCEIEPYCQQVLKKNFPGVPIFDDIRTLKGTDIGAIDIITGGYPCQPFSVAGKQKAEQDPRHLWPEYFRLIQELKPTWVIGENVSGHIKLGLDSVLEDLESEGYSTRTFSISASSIGANHKRERIWTVAYTNSKRGCLWETNRQNAEDVRQSPRGEETFGWWEAEPRVGRVAHGIPKRVDRLKSLGNAVVPHIPYYIGQAIIESYQ
jgi:DNA (cytosine-5)-methyltransferase 1